MPDWLIEIVRQFPIVAVIGVAAYYAEKRLVSKELRLEARTDKLLKDAHDREAELRREVRGDRDAEIQRLLATQQAVVAAKDEQLARLTGELERLRKELAALSRKLQG